MDSHRTTAIAKRDLKGARTSIVRSIVTLQVVRSRPTRVEMRADDAGGGQLNSAPDETTCKNSLRSVVQGRIEGRQRLV